MSYPNDSSAAIKILSGIQIEEPEVFIPWDTSASDLAVLFSKYPLTRVTDDYYTIKDVRLLNNLTCNIGLHFDNMLTRVEFFRNDYSDLDKSYNEFQMIFESKFGKPSKRIRDLANFESCEWDICNRIKIHHYVIDRFGLTEYLYIRRI